jgi:hypothetical protein
MEPVPNLVYVQQLVNWLSPNFPGTLPNLSTQARLRCSTSLSPEKNIQAGVRVVESHMVGSKEQSVHDTAACLQPHIKFFLVIT